MKRALWVGLLVVLSLGWIVACWENVGGLPAGPALLAADTPASKDKAGDKKDAAGQDKAPDGSSQQESNRVKYARTYLSLAKLDLDIAQARNRTYPETLPPALMLVFEENVHLAELWVEQEQAEVEGKSPADAAVKAAEIRLKAAELNYKQLQEANRLSKLTPQRLERARLKVELAKLNVAGAKELEGKPPVELVEFEMERLREEVSELYVRQLKLLDRN